MEGCSWQGLKFQIKSGGFWTAVGFCSPTSFSLTKRENFSRFVYFVACVGTCICTGARIETDTHALIQTHTSVHACTRSHTHTHTHTLTHTHTHTHKHTHTHTHKHASKQACAHVASRKSGIAPFNLDGRISDLKKSLSWPC